MQRKIRMGMVGGGPGSFIGAVHRRAANLDGLIELVAGCFSTDPGKNAATGRELFLDPARCYSDYRAMFDAEARRADRMDFVAVVTPNATHCEIAMAALEHGFDVVCDKPMTVAVAEAEMLAAKVESTGRLFCLTHNYTAYPMVREAKALVAGGELGAIRKIIVEYPQGWLAAPVGSGNKQGQWRTDPKQSGISCCIGDIGSHAENLAEFITGLRITEMCADLHSFVPGRTLDDDGSILLHFDNGARGVLMASQVAVGEENPFRIRIYGETAALEWCQEYPENLILKRNDAPRQLLRRNWAGRGVAGSRLPAGHPEGFFEAFANLYSDFARHIAAHHAGEGYQPAYPTVEDGVRGMKFITAAVASRGRWVTL